MRTAKKFNTMNIRESRRTASGGRGSNDGWQRIGRSAAMEVIRGMTAFKRRYSASDDGLIDFAARVYSAALTPLKLTVRDIARGRLAGKFRIQRTKHTVLNQQMLHPANKQRRNTCHKVHKREIHVMPCHFGKAK